MNFILNLLNQQSRQRLLWLTFLTLVIFWACACSIIFSVILTVEGLGW